MTAKKVDSIKVRMYRHGFGDCFLLSFFHRNERTFSMLIDCGIKHNTESKGIPIKTIIDDLTATLTPLGKKKPVIDVLVATHEHWDHISFFHPRFKQFQQFDIKETWLAWTEDPEDDVAVTINSRLRTGAAALQLSAGLLNDAKSEDSAQFRRMGFGKGLDKARTRFNAALNDVVGFYGVTSESVSGIKYKKKPKKLSVDTEEAMTRIISLGKKGGIKYLEPGKTVDKRRVPEGVNIYVLGPPRSKLINKSNPSSGPKHETYFGVEQMGLAGFVDAVLQSFGLRNPNGSATDTSAPFGDDSGLPASKAAEDPYFKKTYLDRREAYRKIENAWLDAAGPFALQLDGAINNTSVVLAIELEASGKVLLFPGDAQVGSWLSWHDHEWKARRGDKTETVKADELLKNTVLYKVSHHGSHNATVKDLGLELMTHPELVAMIPEKQKSYPGILYQPLMDRLDELCKGRVIVSADKDHLPTKLKSKRPTKLSTAEWNSFKKKLDVQDLYVEYTVE